MKQPPIDDPLLLGYLLDSLDDHDKQRVDQALENDAGLRDRLADLELRFASLIQASHCDAIEPAGDLASRTIVCIREGLNGQAAVASQRRLQKCRRFAMFDRLLYPIGANDLGTESRTGRTGLFRNLLELSAFSISMLVLGTIGLSWVLQTQERARQRECSFQLASLGLAIQDYAFHQREQVAPELAPSGPLSFAGVYAVRLNDQRLLSSENTLWCPASFEVRDWLSTASQNSLPSASDLMLANQRKLNAWQRWIGGSYAYNLGVIRDDEYMPTRFLSRSHFAIMGDAPKIIEGKIRWSAHGLYIANILYEDGSVRLQRTDKLGSHIDHPYFNRDGLLQAGCDENDAAMGPSFYKPLSSNTLINLPQSVR